MPNWKKVIVSGSAAEITELKATGLSAIGASERTTLMISATGVVGTSELGSNAFNSNSIRSYTAGGGLTLTGTVFSHTDTSARSSENGSGRTYIQDITLDTYGHVTGITTSAETVVNTDTQLSDAQVRSKHTGGTNVSINSSGVISSTDTNTQLNSTQVRSNFTGGSKVSINSSGVISSTDTNTTYSVGDGGLSQKNFTSTLKTKLDGIATSANLYIHPTSAGNKHIPSGGSAGQYLRYSASGTAVWAADNNTNTQLSDTYVIGLFTGGTNVSIASNGTISSTDTNTTYSVGDGGLTQKNFTTALKAKLDAIPTLTSNTDVDTGTETVMSVDDASIGVFFDYVVSNGTNLRAGTVTSVHDGTNVEYTETSTADLGDTNDLTLSVDISAGNVRLRATAKSDNWSVKVLARLI